MKIVKLDINTFGILDDVDPSVCGVTGALQVGVLSIYHNHDGAGCDNLRVHHPGFGELDLEFLRSCVIIDTGDD